MTDFLTRLIGRNLGRWPVVQPQITSLYAPGPTLAGLEERPEDTVPGMAPSPPVGVMDTPLGDPASPFAPPAPSPALESPPSIPRLFAAGDRPTLPLTRLPRPIAPLPASQPPSLDSVAPVQQAPEPGSATASPAAVPLSDLIERSESPSESATPLTNLSVENFEPNAPQVRLAPDIANPSPAAISQAVAPSSSLPAAQPVSGIPVSATSSVEAAIAPTPLPQSTPSAQSAPAVPGASTPSIPLGNAAAILPPSAQPGPARAAQSSFPNGSEAMAMGQSASDSPPLVRPLGLPSQEPATAADRPQRSVAPGESLPPVVAPLLPPVAPAPGALLAPVIPAPQASIVPPTVTPALAVPAPVDPVPQALRQGSAASAPAVPTIHVTIGRIDVRAITPPSPPPSRARRTPAAPQLSLNDYLTSRDQTP